MKNCLQNADHTHTVMDQIISMLRKRVQ